MKNKSEVADFIANQIQVIGKSQIKISEEAGFDKPNMITMIKQGKTKVPVNKICSLAKALEVNPYGFSMLCLTEYKPDLANLVETMVLMGRANLGDADAI